MKEHINTGLMIATAFSCVVGYWQITDRIDATFESSEHHDADIRKIRRELLNAKLATREARVIRMEASFKGVPIDAIPSPEARLYEQSIEGITRIKVELAEMDKFR
jgi:hypothetical protein